MTAATGCAFGGGTALVDVLDTAMCQRCLGLMSTFAELCRGECSGPCAICREEATHLIGLRRLCRLHHDVLLASLERTVFALSVTGDLGRLPGTEEGGAR